MREIKSTGRIARESYKDFGKPMPPGWARFKMPSIEEFVKTDSMPDGLFFPDGCQDYVYRHKSMPSTDSSWYWPFPVPDIATTQRTMPEQLPNLACETHRAYLRSFYHYQSRNVSDIGLYHDSSHRIGFLHIEVPSNIIPGVPDTFCLKAQLSKWLRFVGGESNGLMTNQTSAITISTLVQVFVLRTTQPSTEISMQFSGLSGKMAWHIGSEVERSTKKPGKVFLWKRLISFLGSSGTPQIIVSFSSWTLPCTPTHCE